MHKSLKHRRSNNGYFLFWLIGAMIVCSTVMSRAGAYENSVKQAKHAMAGRQYKKAISQLQRALEISKDKPTKDWVTFNLAVCYEKAMPWNAPMTYAQLYAESPESPYAPEAALRLLSHYLETKQYPEAAKLLDAITERWPNTEYPWRASQIVQSFDASIEFVDVPDNLAKPSAFIYFVRQARHDPDEFSRQAVQVIAAANTAKSIAALTLPAALASLRYTALCNEGRMEEACELYEKMQANFTRSGADKAWGKEHERVFRNSWTNDCVAKMVKRHDEATNIQDAKAANKYAGYLGMVTASRKVVAGRVDKSAGVHKDAPKISPAKGMNLQLLATPNEQQLIMRQVRPLYDWFAVSMTDLSTKHETVIEFPVESLDRGIGWDNEAIRPQFGDWEKTLPVVTYADPNRFSMYECYRKDAQGRWVSSDPGKQGQAKYAGIDTLPMQNIVPEALASYGLSPNGQFWSAWYDGAPIEAQQNLQLLTVTQQFHAAQATIANRVPFSYSYLMEWTKYLTQLKVPGLVVENICMTPGGRTLPLIRIETPVTASMPNAVSPQQRPTVVLYARERATETDGSWMTFGAVQWLLSDDAVAVAARQHVNWLIIPMLDPDSVETMVPRSGEFFTATGPHVPEAQAIAEFLIAWLDSGHRIDLVVNLRSGLGAKAPNLVCQAIAPTRKQVTGSFLKALFADAADAGISISNDHLRPEVAHFNSRRLANWCEIAAGATAVRLDTNSRLAASALSLPEIQAMGEMLARHGYASLSSPSYIATYEEIACFLHQRRIDREAWWQREGHGPQERTAYDLFTMGY